MEITAAAVHVSSCSIDANVCHAIGYRHKAVIVRKAADHSILPPKYHYKAAINFSDVSYNISY